MKGSYRENIGITKLFAVAIVASHADGKMLERINVPSKHRGKGIGSKLLKQVLADADCEGIKLYLHISAGDGLTDAELTAWYKRYGFVEYNALTWVRHPIKQELQNVYSK